MAAAHAHAQGTLTGAAEGLRESPVYVHPNAERALSDSEAAPLRRLIRSTGAGPMYVVVLPASAGDEAGADPSAALREIAQQLREPGTYAGGIGDAPERWAWTFRRASSRATPSMPTRPTGRSPCSAILSGA